MFSSLLKRSISTGVPSYVIKDVTVVGGGLMGSGIAQVTAQSGRTVTLIDQTEDILNKARNGIAKSLRRTGNKTFAGDKEATSKLVTETLGNIKFSTDPIEAVKNTDLVIEAIAEDREAKKSLFKELDKVASPSTIFASNTSGFLIKSIAEVTNRKDKFGGLHFFSPVPMMKLLEIVKTSDMSEPTYNELREFGESIGKVCVKCKDTPGFIVNRLLIPYIIQAVLLAERGVASYEDIDTAMKLGCGYPMGPIQLLDFAGIDTFNAITEGWVRDYPDEPNFTTSKTLQDLAAKGHTGMKAGKGIYEYKK